VCPAGKHPVRTHPRPLTETDGICSITGIYVSINLQVKCSRIRSVKTTMLLSGIHMTIALKTQKMLWGRSAARCSMPECRIELVQNATETDDETVIGENCHIVAESDEGPRANPTMPLEQRNTYNNLILLCSNHHKIIDSQEGEYTVARLHEIKKNHEGWVREQLGIDDNRQYDEEIYAGIIDTWMRLAHVDMWDKWTGFMLSNGQPSMPLEIDTHLEELRTWLLNRIWPDRYPELNKSFENFRRVLQDLHNLFRKHAEPWGEDFLITRKFYQIDRWDPEMYSRLSDNFDFHVALVEDLTLELTRSANLICNRIRQFIMRSYRMNEGHLFVTSGMYMDLSWHTNVVLYRKEEQEEDYPYRGLKMFMTDRANRDLRFGEGVRDINPLI